MALRYKAEIVEQQNRDMIKLTDDKTGDSAFYDDKGAFVLGTLTGVDIREDKILDQLYWSVAIEDGADE